MNTQAHNIMLTNNGTVSEHGAVPQARVVADCPHPPKSDRFDKVCLCFTKREARLLSTDHCSLITRHLPITDLSQSLQGAGGVGGLLSSTKMPASGSPLTYYPLYDGNGNITAYIDNSCTVEASFDYDPFGNITNSNKTPALPYAFSTKPRDASTGLYYYGYRYYEPNLGRWISSDPIDEGGGLNLYGFVNNDGMNKWYYFGMLPNKGKCCCVGETPLSANEKCCNSGKTVNCNDKCVIRIIVGHCGDATTKYIDDLATSEYGRKAKIAAVGTQELLLKIGSASCLAIQQNSETMTEFQYDNQNRTNALLDLWSESNQAEKFKNALDNEIKAAKIEAEKQCLDLSSCCNQVLIIVTPIDRKSIYFMKTEAGGNHHGAYIAATHVCDKECKSRGGNLI